MAFLLALAPHQLQLSGSLEDVSPCFQCGKMVPGSRGSRANLIYKLFCMSVLSGTIWRTDARHLPLFHLTQNSPRPKKLVDISWKYCKATKQSGAKAYSWHTLDNLEIGGRAEERDSLGSLRHSKAITYMGNLESYMHAQSKIHAQKRPENTISIHFGLIPRISASMAKC